MKLQRRNSNDARTEDTSIPFYSLVKEFGDWQNGNEKWVQMYPYGEWTHPIYTDTKIDRATADKMVQNFNDKVINKKVLADYDHGQDKAKGGKSAGEIIKVEARDNGLWGLVRFNDIAKKEIDDGEWQYWSTSHFDAWEDPQTKQTHEFVIDSGALTNRPYVRGMAPLNFSEVFTDALHDEDTESESEVEWHDESGILKEHSVISGGERNSLPDSAFLYIEPGGKKDSGGRTVPRNLRHLIVVDHSHQAAAKSRLSQSNTGTVEGDSWLTDSLRKSLLARVNKMLGSKDHSEGGGMDDKDKTDEATVAPEVELVANIRKQFSLADDADVTAWIQGMNDELEPLRELKTQTEAKKKFNEEYPEEAERLKVLEQRDRTASAKEFSESYKDMRVVRKNGTGDDATDEPTTLGFSALVLETIQDGAKKFSDGEFTADDFKTTLDAIMNNGIVDYGTAGSSREPNIIEPANSVRGVRKQFSDVIAQIQQDDELDFEAAYKVAAEKHPELYQAYKTNKPVVLPN